MSRWTVYSLALLVLLLDQGSKAWVVRTFALNESRDLVPGFFSLTLVRNTGGAFSILPDQARLLALAAAFAAVAIIVSTARTRGRLPRALGVALALPLGGALGNLADRVRFGSVVDFLDWHIGTHQWPVSNIADVSICVGVALLAVYFWRLPTESPNPPAPFPVKEEGGGASGGGAARVTTAQGDEVPEG